MKAKIPQVAILIETSTSWGYRLSLGIGAYAQTHGPWALYLEPRGIEEPLVLPQGWKGDGIIAGIRTDALAQQVRAMGVPVVNMSGIQLPDCAWPRVLTDEHEIARLAVDHLRERGLKQVAYCSEAQWKYLQERAQIFQAVAEKAGLSWHCYQGRPPGAQTWIAQQQALVQWLVSLPKPVGVVAWNMVLGRRLTEACRAADIHIPEEVAIVCVGSDELMGQIATPPLSGVALAYEKMGYEAAAILDRMMQGQPAPASDLLIPPLGIQARQSTDVLCVENPDVRAALRFIRQHACEPIDVSEILRAVPISRRALEKQMRHLIGRSPGEEIRRLRLERARQLLVETHLPIPLVAQKSGFSYVERFIPAFRQSMGLTPLQYRKQMQPASRALSSALVAPRRRSASHRV